MGTIEKAGGRRAGSGREIGEVRSRPLLFSPGFRSPLIPLVARSLFRSSSLTKSLEQANGCFASNATFSRAPNGRSKLIRPMAPLQSREICLANSDLWDFTTKFLSLRYKTRFLVLPQLVHQDPIERNQHPSL